MRTIVLRILLYIKKRLHHRNIHKTLAQAFS